MSNTLLQGGKIFAVFVPSFFLPSYGPR